MRRLRKVIALFWSMSLFCAWFAPAQDLILRPSAPTDLKLLAILGERTKNGVKTAFRIYEAPDGSRGQISYVKFDSLQAAKEQIEDWIKSTSKVTSREQNQINSKGQLVSDRLLAAGKLREEFVIVRRDDLTCYLIESGPCSSLRRSKP